MKCRQQALVKGRLQTSIVSEYGTHDASRSIIHKGFQDQLAKIVVVVLFLIYVTSAEWLFPRKQRTNSCPCLMSRQRMPKVFVLFSCFAFVCDLHLIMFQANKQKNKIWRTPHQKVQYCSLSRKAWNKQNSLEGYNCRSAPESGLLYT